MEFVFVVPRTALFPDFYPHGLVPFSASHSGGHWTLSEGGLAEVVSRDGFFVERAYAERTPSLKQIIPYSIVHCDTPQGARVLVTRRLLTGGESRLHGKHSIGIGGHIEPEDLDTRAGSARDPIAAGTRREIAEELVVRGAYEIRRIGLLNDDSNPVGAVHVGVVQVMTASPSVDIREKDQLEGRLVSIAEVRAMLAGGANFETWSKLLVPHLDEFLHPPLAVHS